MPNPPAQPPTSLITQVGFTAGGGSALMPSITQVHTLPSIAPPANSNDSTSTDILGFDAVPFTLTLAGGLAAAQTLTFPQLPSRNNTQNPLSPQMTAAQQPLTVQAIDHLLFMVTYALSAAPNGTVVGILGQAIDLNNLRVPGPFLGSNQFLTFQAVVSANSSTATGTITGIAYGVLLLCSG